jgi:hypothetical protein
MPPKRPQAQQIPPDLSFEKAFAHLSQQIEKLQTFRNKNYQDAQAEEEEWFQLTHKLIQRAFGSGSPNAQNFGRATSAGEHRMVVDGWGGHAGIDHAQNQRNFVARTIAYENALKSSLAELKLDLPEPEIKGVYEPGQEYEFYKGMKTTLGFATQELFVIDPYLSREIFETYADSIPRAVKFRLLGAIIPSDVAMLAQKYATGGNFQLRSSTAIHDRVIFADNRVWVVGQSLKDAAKKKPTYIVEFDEGLMRPAYEPIWTAAQTVL